MSEHQAMKGAIEAFQPGDTDAPILYSTTEANESGFKALLGRKLKSRPVSVALWVCICALVVIAASTVISVAFGRTVTPAFTTFIPIYIIYFYSRTTLITVGDKGLDYYFIESKRGSKYIVYDKVSLPYDRITNVKAKTGRFNTSFTFVFSNDDKNYKIKTSVPNKMKKMEEQAENLKHLLKVLEQKSQR